MDEKDLSEGMTEQLKSLKSKKLLDDDTKEKMKTEIEAGIITSCAAVISTYSLGLMAYFVYRFLEKNDKDKALKMIKDVMSVPKTEVDQLIAKHAGLFMGSKDDPQYKLMRLFMSEELDEACREIEKLVKKTAHDKIDELERGIITVFEEIKKQYEEE